MAFDYWIQGAYDGRPNHYLQFYVRRDQADANNNRSAYAWELKAVRASGALSWSNACYSWSARVGDQFFSGCHGLDFSSGISEIILAQGTTGWYSHDGNGNLSLLIGAQHGPADQFGLAHPADAWFGTDTLAKVPAKPNAPTARAVQTTSMVLDWVIPSNGGATIDAMLLRRYENADLSGGYTDYPKSGTSTSHAVTGLTIGKQYYWRVYARNAVGYSPGSNILTQGTIAAGAPGISVSPSLSGLSSTMTFTSPGGATGVTEYNYEYRLVAGPGPVTVGTTTTNTATANALTPGATYEYRVNAEFGPSYTTVWSNWTSLTQPAPNTNPGNYFDGATTASTDTTYAWSGAVNNSTSIATGKNVTGWRTFAQGSGTSGGTGVVARVSGGYAGLYASRVTFWSDATAAGFIAGVDVSGAATVDPGAIYYGSIHVRLPGRTQRLEPGIAWFTSANALVSITWGDAVVLAASTTDWTRMAVLGTAPPTATKAAPVVHDVTGTSWALWRGGDQILTDAAMVTLGELHPYFDGSTTSTTEFWYAWDGTPDASPSTRTILLASETDPLADPNCPPVAAPPEPPIIASDCIDEVGTWRRYTVEIPANEIPLWSSTLPSLILSTGPFAERQVRIRYYPNADGRAAELVETTFWDSELILTYIPPNTVMTLDSVTQRVRAQVGTSPVRIANQLLYGTNGTPATWPELRCGIGYVVTLDVPLEAPTDNLKTRVLLTSKV